MPPSGAAAMEPPPCPDAQLARECPECPDPIVIDSKDCEDAKRVLMYRNAKSEERMDECLQANEYFNCHYWVFGYYFNDEEEDDEVPPPRPED